MVSFTNNIEETIMVGTQQNEVFKGRYKMQGKDGTLVKTDDSKTIIPFLNKSNITSTNYKLNTTVAIRNILNLLVVTYTSMPYSHAHI